MLEEQLSLFTPWHRKRHTHKKKQENTRMTSSAEEREEKSRRRCPGRESGVGRLCITSADSPQSSAHRSQPCTKLGTIILYTERPGSPSPAHCPEPRESPRGVQYVRRCARGEDAQRTRPSIKADPCPRSTWTSCLLTSYYANTLQGMQNDFFSNYK